MLIAVGIWGISFSRRRELDFTSLELLVCEKKTISVCAWFAYFSGLVLMLFSFFLACADESSCLIAALSGMAVLFSGILLFSSYRNRRITIHGNQIIGANILGQTYSYSKSDINDIRFALATGGYKIFDNYNKMLFRFETNMKNADKLFAALDGSSYCDFTASVAETKHKLQQKFEINWNTDNESWQTQHAKKITTAFRVLVVVNVLLTIFLFFICPSTLLKFKYRILLIQIQPLLYFFFAWIFNQSVSWLGTKDANASEEWKMKHVSLGWGFVHGALILIFLSSDILPIKVNLVSNATTVYMAEIVLTVILGGISFFRAYKMPGKIITAIIIGFASVSTAMGLIPAAIYAAADPASNTHYPAQILSTKESRSRYNTSYYARVRLRDGRKHVIEISSPTYNDIESGAAKLVCENTAPFDIIFVSLHGADD